MGGGYYDDFIIAVKTMLPENMVFKELFGECALASDWLVVNCNDFEIEVL